MIVNEEDRVVISRSLGSDLLLSFLIASLESSRLSLIFTVEHLFKSLAEQGYISLVVKVEELHVWG